MAKYDKADLERRMHGAVEALKSDLSGLRTGRAHTALLDPVTVEVYGSHMPLNQVASVSAPEPRMLSVQVWDKSNVGPVDKAIRSAGLGGIQLGALSPTPDYLIVLYPALFERAGGAAQAKELGLSQVRAFPGWIDQGQGEVRVYARPTSAP